MIGALIATTSCGEEPFAGPRHTAPARASFSVAPAFSAIPTGGPTIVLARIRGVLIGAGRDSTVVESSFAGDTAVLAFEVNFTGESATFTLDLTGFDANGVAVFHGRQQITVKPGDNPPLPGPQLTYSGPDAGLQVLHVSPDSLQLNAGATSTLNVSGVGPNSQSISSLRVGWTSTNPAIATVDSNGTVHAGQSQGWAYIVARTATNVADSALIAVHAPVATVLVAPSALTLARGQAGSVGAELRDAGGHLIDDRVATWSTSDSTVATVSAQGVIQAVKIGIATITATAEGKTGTAAVTVVSPIDHIELSSLTLTFSSLHATQTLTARLVPRTGASVAGLSPSFSSSSAAVASIDASGVATALANGSATITVTADGVTATAPVTVKQIAVSVTISPKSGGVTALGNSRTFMATAADSLGNPLTGAQITWTSSNPHVGSVSFGVVTGLAVGSANITAAAGAKSDVATFTVIQVPRLLSVSADKSQITVGDSATLSATLADANGNPMGPTQATFTSSTPSVASVTAGGRVVGLAAGTAQFVGTAGSITSAITITVALAPPTPGGDLIVFNDIKMFDDVTGAPHAGNVQLYRNLVDYAAIGPRARQNTVWVHRGKGSSCDVCSPTDGWDIFENTMRGEGYSVYDVSDTASLAAVPSAVKLIVLTTPQKDFTVAEINGLKQFSAEGGRILFVGAWAGLYGDGITVENDFLTSMGAVMRNTGGEVSCLELITNIQPHQVATNTSSGIEVGCPSAMQLGPNDYPLLINAAGQVVGAVAKVNLTPVTLSSDRRIR